MLLAVSMVPKERGPLQILHLRSFSKLMCVHGQDQLPRRTTNFTGLRGGLVLIEYTAHKTQQKATDHNYTTECDANNEYTSRGDNRFSVVDCFGNVPLRDPVDDSVFPKGVKQR